MAILRTVYETKNMQMTSLAFILVILPIFLFVYYLVPGRARPAVLLGISLIYYLLVDSYTNFILMILSVAFDYALLRLMSRWEDRPPYRRACMWLSVAKNLGLILYFGAMAQIRSAPLLLGLQIYTLSAMGCVISAYREKQRFQGNLLQFFLYCCFFPRLFVGPLTLWEEFLPQLRTIKLDLRQVFIGAGQFLQGAIKAMVIGGTLFSLYHEIGKVGEETALSSWCLVFSVAFALYFLLSGVSDIAQGVGAMFGLVLPKNFYYPYQSRNVTDFFDRFNITVGRFIRRVVYVGLDEDKNGPLADTLNILLMGILMGLWFGLRLNYLAWGAYLAAFVIMERYLYPKVVERIPTLFARFFTLCIVLSSFTIFSGDSLAGSFRLIRSMLDFRVFFNDEILYLLSSNWLLILLSCFFATNVVNLIVTKFRRAAPALSMAILGAVDVGILIVYIALAM